MPVTIADVERIASLANLEFSDEEKVQFLQSFNQILTHMEKIAELDLSQVEPSAHLMMEMPLRDDCVQPSLARESALANAPVEKEGYFSVPKVIGG